jgi:hypothetical protein
LNEAAATAGRRGCSVYTSNAPSEGLRRMQKETGVHVKIASTLGIDLFSQVGSINCFFFILPIITCLDFANTHFSLLRSLPLTLQAVHARIQMPSWKPDEPSFVDFAIVGESEIVHSFLNDSLKCCFTFVS